MGLRVSIEHLGDGAPGGCGVRRKSGKGSPKSGDLSFLTMEPNRFGTHVTRHPHPRDSPLPWSFL